MELNMTGSTSALVVVVILFGIGLFAWILVKIGQAKTKQHSSHSSCTDCHCGEDVKSNPQPLCIFGPQCPHEPFVGKATLVGKGKEIEVGQVIDKSLQSCAACLEVYFEKYCAVCAVCGEPILPGESVGLAEVNAPHPHTHMYMDCCVTAAFYCGVWGEGKLHGIPGGTIVGQVMATGKMAIGNTNKAGQMEVTLVDLPNTSNEKESKE